MRPGLIFCLFVLMTEEVQTQTVVTVGGGATITCPATPVASWAGAPTGITFSNWARGSGVSCASASNALNGSGFNTANGAASFSANKYYTVTITADAGHSFILSGLIWSTAVSSGTASFDIKYSNNGGVPAAFGSTGTSTISNTFTGLVTVEAGTSIILYLIPSGTSTAGTTVRWVNGSTITLSAFASPLPVSLVQFSATEEGSRIRLHWTTATEQNNLGFEVQRSEDAVSYSGIGFVNTLALNGSSVDILHYAFTDSGPTRGKQYYRLKQRDIDGNSKISPVVLVRANPISFPLLTGIFPNPAGNFVNANIISDRNKKMILLIMDMVGRTLIWVVSSLEPGSNTVPVDLSRLPQGIYALRLVPGDCLSASPGENGGILFIKK